VQHLWIQVGAPEAQTSFLTGFIMVYTHRWQEKKLSTHHATHRAYFAAGFINNSGADLPTRSWAASTGCNGSRQLPSAEHRSPQRHCLQPWDSTQLLQRSCSDLRQVKKIWPRVWFRLPTEKQAGKQRLMSRCRAAGQQQEPSRLLDLLGGCRLTPVSPHVVYWDSGRTQDV